MKTFRVNQINSSRNTNEVEVLKFIGDFTTLEEAQEVYDSTNYGMEVDKELLEIANIIEINTEIKVLETTF